MSNKLTKKKIDLLIEQVMSEDFSNDDLQKIFTKRISGADISKGRDTGLPPAGAKDVIGNVVDPPQDNKLNKKDLEYFINNPEKIDVKVQASLIAISKVGGGGDPDAFDKRIKKLQAKRGALKYPTTKEKLQIKIEFNIANKDELLELAGLAEDALAALEEKIKQASQKDQSLTTPVFKTVSGASGVFPKDQITVVDRIFKGLNTFKDRMNKLKVISETFYSSAGGDDGQIQALKRKKPSQLLAEIQLIDLFNSMSKEIDEGAGAYIFEYFLAMMMGGNVAGKSKTEAGKMGAVDFELNGKRLHGKTISIRVCRSL